MARSREAYVPIEVYRFLKAGLVTCFLPHENVDIHGVLSELGIFRGASFFSNVSDVVLERQPMPQGSGDTLKGYVKGRVTKTTDKDVTLEIESVGGGRTTTVPKGIILRPNQVINIRTGKKPTSAS